MPLTTPYQLMTAFFCTYISLSYELWQLRFTVYEVYEKVYEPFPGFNLISA